MRSVLKIVGGLLAALLLVIAGLLVGARFADGPLAIMAGGPFTSGELVTGPEPDWSFVNDVGEVEFQLLEPARSRTTWILHHEGKAYIPCGYMTTWWGKIWKQWPHYLVDDDRVILRIDGNLYQQRMIRLMDHPQLLEFMTIFRQKYGAAAESDVTVEQLREALTLGDYWLFEVVDRET